MGMESKPVLDQCLTVYQTPCYHKPISSIPCPGLLGLVSSHDYRYHTP